MLTVILDAAHGKNVPGKCSPDKSFQEYIWSRVIVRQVKTELEKLSYKVFETVEGDFEPGIGSRVRRANAIESRNKLLLTFHVNAAGKEDKWLNARGYEVYTSKGQTKADICADYIMKCLSKAFPDFKARIDTTDGDYDKEENFYLLTGTNFPAVYIEWLFMDNKIDLEYLTNDNCNQLFVMSIVKAVVLYDNKLNTIEYEKSKSIAKQ